MLHKEPIPSIPTEELLHRCTGSSQGQNQAWRALIRRYEPAVRSGVRRGWTLSKKGRPQAADLEDLVQEVYCHLLAAGRRRLRRCHGQGRRRVGAFLYQMAVRVVLDQHRHESAQRRGGEPLPGRALPRCRMENLPAPEGRSNPRLRLERCEALRAALRRHAGGLPRRRRDIQIWLLSAAGGFNRCEIVAAMPGRLTQNQVSKALRRVRHSLSTLGESLESLL